MMTCLSDLIYMLQMCQLAIKEPFIETPFGRYFKSVKNEDKTEKYVVKTCLYNDMVESRDR
jgi:hypothetical protein